MVPSLLGWMTLSLSWWVAPGWVQGVAITQRGSLLDETARLEEWLARFPMFDWIGGRTSEMSAVGLLPAAVQVRPIASLIRGASLAH